MSRGDAGKLSAPARKVFAEQLQTCSRQNDLMITGVTGTDLDQDAQKCWLMKAIPGKPTDMTDLRLEIVWLQGTVLESDPEWIVIHDGTGRVRGELNDVRKANKIMAGDAVVSKGMVPFCLTFILPVHQFSTGYAVHSINIYCTVFEWSNSDCAFAQ